MDQKTISKHNRRAAIDSGGLTYIGAPCKVGHNGTRYTKTKACCECVRMQGASHKAANSDKERQRKREWKLSNPDKVKLEKCRYRQNNRATIGIRNRDYRRRDPHGTIALRAEFNAASAAIRAKERVALRGANREQLRLERLAKERARNEERRFFMTSEELEQSRKKAREEYRKKKAANPEAMRMRDRLARSRRRAKIRNANPDATASQIRELLAAQGGRCAYCGSAENLHLDHKIPLSRAGRHTIGNLQWLCGYHNMNKHASTDAEYRRRNGIPQYTEFDPL